MIQVRNADGAMIWMGRVVLMVRDRSSWNRMIEVIDLMIEEVMFPSVHGLRIVDVVLRTCIGASKSIMWD